MIRFRLSESSSWRSTDVKYPIKQCETLKICKNGLIIKLPSHISNESESSHYDKDDARPIRLVSLLPKNRNEAENIQESAGQNKSTKDSDNVKDACSGKEGSEFLEMGSLTDHSYLKGGWGPLVKLSYLRKHNNSLAFNKKRQNTTCSDSKVKITTIQNNAMETLQGAKSDVCDRKTGKTCSCDICVSEEEGVNKSDPDLAVGDDVPNNDTKKTLLPVVIVDSGEQTMYMQYLPDDVPISKCHPKDSTDCADNLQSTDVTEMKEDTINNNKNKTNMKDDRKTLADKGEKGSASTDISVSSTKSTSIDYDLLDTVSFLQSTEFDSENLNSDINMNEESQAKQSLMDRVVLDLGKEPVYLDLDIENMISEELLALGQVNEPKMRPFQCGHCQKTFTYKHHLVVHMLLHSNKKKFTCPVCQRKFRLRHHLTQHFRLHSGERPYVCVQCNATFVSSSNLKRHKLTHQLNKGKKYRCKICARMFSSNYHLQRHKSCHDDSRPFKCEFCNANFKRKEHLARHEEIHSKQNGNTYPCPHCNKVFCREASFNSHIQKCEVTEEESDSE